MRSKLIVSTLLVLALLSLAACGRDRTENSDATEAENTPAETVVTTGDEIPPAATETVDAAASTSAEATTEAPVAIGSPIMPSPLYFIDATTRQVVRLEADGQTTTPLTSESTSISDFDVTPDGGRLAFVTNNTLIELDLVDGTRTVKVEGEPISDEDSEDRFSRRIHDLHYSPDGNQIAFGLAGVNLVDSGSSSDVFPLLPSSPYPDPTNPPPQSADEPIRFYWPKSWAPDGAKILVEFANFPEAGGLAIFDLTQNQLINFTSDDPAAVACCDAAWSPSGDELTLASNFLVYGNPGLSVVNTETGAITNLVAGMPPANGNQAGDAEPTFSFFRAPYVLSQATDGGAGNEIAVFLNQTSNLSDQMLGYSLTSVARSTEDNGVTITPLRSDAVALEGEVVWLADGSGVAYLKDLKIEGEKPTGSVVWAPVNGEPVDLPVTGKSLHWIAPTFTVPATASAAGESTSMPQEDEESAELSIFAADLWGFSMEGGETSGPGIKGVFSFPLPSPNSALPLWASHTYGLRSFDPEQYQTVGIFTRQDGEWQEISRLELGKEVDTNNPEPVPDYVDKGSVFQVFIEPEHIWLHLEGGVGAHSGVFNLLSFDGETLRTEASAFSASPDVASTADLNDDGNEEVIIDETDYYVFCYACGVRLVQYGVLRWNRAYMDSVTPEPLPRSSPTELSALNDLALTQVKGGLWKGALEAIEEGRLLNIDDPTFEWNGIVIALNAEAKRAVADDPDIGYPILDQMFYGDYEAAVDVMRSYGPDEIFTLDTPLIIGTAAEGSTELLADWITRTATLALSVQPELAPAHYLRGWAGYLTTEDPEIALQNVAVAAAMASDDLFYQESVAYLLGDDIPTRTPAPTLTSTMTSTMTSTVAPTVPLAEAPTKAPQKTGFAGSTPTPPGTEATGTSEAEANQADSGDDTAGDTGTSAPEPTPSPTTAGTRTNTLTARTLINIRSEPSTGADILGELAEGDTARVSGRTGEGDNLWLQIVFPAGSEKRGWVSGAPSLVDIPPLTSVPAMTVTSTAPEPTAVTASPSAAGPGRIFYSAQDDDGVSTIFQLMDDGGVQTVVVQAEQPAIQPGARRLAFHSTRDDMLGLGGYDLDTEERLRFSYSNEDQLPTWDPALQQIIFASTRYGDGRSRLYHVWGDGNGDATDLGYGQDPNWHPSQELIVLKGCDAAGAKCGLWTMTPDGNNRQRQTENANDARPVWSRSGDAVVFMSNDRDGNWELYRLDVADGVVTRLTDNPANDGLPAISPDGSRIAFMSDRGGVWTLQTMPIGGGPAETLHTIGGNVADWLSQGIAWER